MNRYMPVIASMIIVGFLIIFYLFAWPFYSVWRAEQEGKAELAKAEQNRQILVQEAKAKKESAELLAEAEVARAKGVAKANVIIGDSLKGNPEYIHYLWIDTLKESKDQVIYIPTEAGIPITESFRLGAKQKVQEKPQE